MASLQVGDWEVDPAANELRRGQEVVRLEPKAIEVLRFLAGRPGEVVGREALIESVWPGVVVGDDALTQAVIKLRRALGDDAHDPRYIETISKRGYRLIAAVGGSVSAALPAGGANAQPRRRNWALAGGLVAIAALGVALVAGLDGRWPLSPGARDGLKASSPPLVAVLPLANPGGDARRDYFGDGLSEDLINALGRFPDLRVLSRNAVEPFRGRQATPRAVHEALGARYVLQGSVREDEGRIRVTVELSDTERSTVLWSHRHEGGGGDIFAIQDRIVTDIVGALAVRVSQLERERLSRRPVQSLEAYDLVLQARALVYRVTRETNRQARELLARAVEIDPEYGEAWVTYAHAEYRRGDQGWVEDPEASLRRAAEYARRALALPDAGAHARAHAQLARVLTHQQKLDEALAEADRAVALNPSDAVALFARGATLLWLGRAAEGTEVLEACNRFDPSLDDAMLPLGYYLQGRYRESVAAADARLGRHPEVVFVRAVRVAALGRLGERDEAAQAAADLRRRTPFFKVELLGVNFRRSEDRAMLQEGLRLAGL